MKKEVHPFCVGGAKGGFVGPLAFGGERVRSVAEATFVYHEQEMTPCARLDNS